VLNNGISTTINITPELKDTVGTFNDNLVVTHNGDNGPTTTIPLRLTVDVPHGTFIYTSDTTITIPPGVTSVQITLVGAGGGQGSKDNTSNGPGYSGLPGKRLVGSLTVNSGDILAFYIGTGGKPGVSGKPAYGGYGGTNSKIGNGGRGGNANVSGAGGGGGGASVIEVNGTTFAIAAGGGGGGGGGSKGNSAQNSGQVRPSMAYVTVPNGANGQGAADAGTGGGGGGGEFGGQGGTAPGGDVGAYQGSQGKSKVPADWTESNDTNGATVDKIYIGGTGYVTITY
jgi:hypothetical protein